MKNVLIDSDVILDFFLDREEFSIHSGQILNLCQKNRIVGFVTPVIICNVHYILSKNANKKIVKDYLNNLLSFINILNTNKTAITTALNSEFSDFEDAVQNYSVEQSQEIDFIITRNIKDYKKSSLGVLTPEIFLSNRNTLL